MVLAQKEADYLLSLHKFIVEKTIDFPSMNSLLTLNVKSCNTNDVFLLDINRKGRISLSRCTFYHRYNTIIGLVRLDLDKDKVHTNPDGEKIIGPHIHIYREEYDTRWAYALDDFEDWRFIPGKDFVDMFYDFCQYCNISYSLIQGSLI